MKPFMKVLGLLVVVVVGAFGVVGCGSSDSSSTSASTPATTAAADAAAGKVAPSYLFSFYGTNATVKPVAGSEMAYDVSIPVDAANTGITWFTDRPNRDAGLMTIKQFAALWTQGGKDSFNANPPNASIVFGSGQGKPKTAIAKMSNTKLVDNPNGTGQLLLTTMTVDTNQEAAALAKSDGFLAVHATRHTTPQTITNADTKRFAVFVDGIYLCFNGGTPGCP
ncbi:MAG: hypothetical protein WCN97_00085 [Thermoleophilia bacterium]